MAEPALALRDHPQIIDLISVLEQNGLQKQKEEVQALVGYIDGMEEKLSQMMDEMIECAWRWASSTTKESAPGAPSLLTLWKVKSARPK